jgi:phosphonate transport system substrate-binding protein
VRDDVPQALAQMIQQALIDLPKTPEGRQILTKMETARFHVANDANYEVVQSYVERFEKEVRAVERK